MASFGKTYLSVLAFLLIATPAFGVIVSPGDNSVLIEPTNLIDASFNGTAIVDETIQPIRDAADASNFGFPDVRAKVIQRADNGMLDFYLAIGTSGTEPNSGFDVNGFAGSTTDVYNYPSDKILPTGASRSAGLGDTLHISTPLSSPAGFFIIRTSETSLPRNQILTYVEGDDTGAPDEIATYPLEGATVPENKSAALFLLAVGALLLRKSLRI